MISSIAIYCLHTVKWFQVLLSTTNVISAYSCKERKKTQLQNKEHEGT